MGRAHKLGVLVALIFWLAAPVLRCASPMMARTAQERACCEAMAMQCGDMQMSAPHSCCSKPSPEHPVLASDRSLNGFPDRGELELAMLMVDRFTMLLPEGPIVLTGQVDTSPPGSPPQTLSSLRL